MLLNKADLLPYVEFDVQACMTAARRVNPGIEIMVVSARSGQGLGEFAGWITAHAGH
jgi:hydrogenase nickel incorporation protein HypB